MGQKRLCASAAREIWEAAGDRQQTQSRLRIAGSGVLQPFSSEVLAVRRVEYNLSLAELFDLRWLGLCSMAGYNRVPSVICQRGTVRRCPNSGTTSFATKAMVGGGRGQNLVEWIGPNVLSARCRNFLDPGEAQSSSAQGPLTFIPCSRS
jgi:hypothetical protein